MKILIVSEDVPTPSMPGLAKHALALTRALAERGHEVDFMGNAEQQFASGDPEARLPGRFFAELRGTRRGWKERQLGCFLPYKRDLIARGIARAILARARDYDVVHYHGHSPNVGVHIPADVNFVQTRHDQGSDCLIHTRFRAGGICTSLAPEVCAGCMAATPNVLQRALSTVAVKAYRDQVQASFRRHKTVFVSRMLLANFSRVAGPGPWGSVVHNFLDVAGLQAAAAAPMRPAGLMTNARLIAYAGSLYEPKGIEPLLELAVPKLPEHVHLLIMGSGPLEQSLRERFAGERVRFLGWCDSKTTLGHMAGADAVIVPSLCEEAFGQTTLEGLMLGKPTYALARGGTLELRAYEAYPGQLRLYDSLQELVAGMLGDVPPNLAVTAPCIKRTVDDAIAELLDVYRAPPSAVLRGETRHA